MLKQILPLLESLNLCVEINKVDENKTILNISMSSKITLDNYEDKKEIEESEPIKKRRKRRTKEEIKEEELTKTIEPKKEVEVPIVNELEDDDNLFSLDEVSEKQEEVIDRIELEKEEDNPFN